MSGLQPYATKQIVTGGLHRRLGQCRPAGPISATSRLTRRVQKIFVLFVRFVDNFFSRIWFCPGIVSTNLTNNTNNTHEFSNDLLLALSNRTNAIKMSRGSDEQLVTRDRWSRHQRLSHFIRGNQLIFAAGFDHDHVPVFT